MRSIRGGGERSAGGEERSLAGIFDRLPAGHLTSDLAPNKDGGVDVVALRSRHSRPDGTTVDFDLQEESHGTQRLANLAPVLFDPKSNRRCCYVIDELDLGLHPLMTRRFVELFLAGCAAANSPSQLLFTTHDTNLLDLELLSRDAVWLVEKSDAGASSLYSLAEFRGKQLDVLTGQMERG